MGWLFIPTQTSTTRKVSREDVTKVLKRKAEENKEAEQILVTPTSVKSQIEVDKEVELSYQAVRDRGIQMDGYYMTKWPKVFDYNKKGDPKNWGLLMKPQLFLEKLKDKNDK